MAGLSLKIGAYALFFSSLATGSYFLRDYYSKERINHRIEEQGMTLLTSSDSNLEWAKRWKEYVAENKNIWRLKDYNKIKAEQAPNSFKEKCLNSSSLALEGHHNFATEIEKFCTKSFKVSDLLSREKGITVLKSEDDQNLWKGVWSKYAEHNKSLEKDPFSITSWATAKNNKETLPSNYVSQCTAEQEKEVRRKQDIIYQNVKNWCAKQN